MEAPREACEEMLRAIFSRTCRPLSRPRGRQLDEPPTRRSLPADDAIRGGAGSRSPTLLRPDRRRRRGRRWLSDGAAATCPKTTGAALILAYLGYPFFDIATLPLLQGEGLDEFDPIKVDRISPDDATAIRNGGAAATLKGIQFNSFGAFFSRAYRENDYLWGRLHGADRLIDIVSSSVGGENAMPAEALATLKRRAFHAILDEEEGRLPKVAALIAELRGEIGPV